MDKSNESLYRKTLLATSGVFILLMCVATTSRALVPHSETYSRTSSESLETKTEITNLGRFVVTPSSASFISAPAETRWDEHVANHIERGAN